MITYVNNVQSFSITIAALSTTGTATISAAVGKQFIIWGGETCNTTINIGEALCYLTISGTTITATRAIGTTGIITVFGYVVDGTSNLITSVQTGTIAITAASSGTATISAVNASNAVLQFLGYTSTGTAFDATDAPILSYSGTTLTATLQTTSIGVTTIAYEVIEYNGAALNSAVQFVNKSWTTASASTTATISNVNVNNSILHYCGAQVQISRDFQYSQLTNGTTITINAGAAVSDAVQYNCYVAEFISAVMQSPVQRGSITMTAATSNTAVVTSTSANAIVNFLGWAQTSGSTANYNILESDLTYSSPTVTANRNTGTGNITIGYEVIDWAVAANTNTITETVTESDGYSALSVDSALFSENQTATDSYLSTRIANLTFSENQTESDISAILAINKGVLTETQTESDNLSTIRTANDGTTEIIISTDTNAVSAIANIIISENEVANDNYDSQLNPSPSPMPSIPPVQTGSGDDRRKRYLSWLAKKKQKQFRQRADRIGIPKIEAIKIADIATKQIGAQQKSLPFSQNTELARHAAQITINQIYENIWQKKVNEYIVLRRQIEEENEFFMMMM